MVNYFFAVSEALEYVSLDSLEGATRQTLCFVCKETLDHHFVTVKEEGSEDHLEKKIACLSCSHFYHRTCIVRWLLTSHLCPFCRHPLVDEAPEFLRQDIMLPMCSSARGDTFVEKIIMETKLLEDKLRKKISKLAPFSFFLFSVFVGYKLLLA
ncbi:hypothetical protein M0R45_029032 [Rubus argutus]|uniref:RING-type E3 ubiquitin transferase n=1 Tax=Rubus argutus TaxID=59490 RepID=A0AAW1WB30_RUBAR